MSIPTRIANRYDVLALLGAGGTGSVYRVRDIVLDEEVALKFLEREVLLTPGALERFIDEVKLARRVTHENVARVFDIGEHGPARFLTMELVSGESLASRMRREGAFDLEATVTLGIALARGLGAAHRAGVVHRDLKPDNVLISSTGRVAITDFGIARTAGIAPRAGAAEMVGSAGYISPEQLRGSADLDGRADIYALGTVLYEVATGKVAWPGNNFMASAMPRLLQPPPDPRLAHPGVPDDLAQVIVRCMALDRQDRFATADALADALVRALHASPRFASLEPPPLPPEALASRAAPLPDADDRTLAVLPLRNAGPAEDDALADELTDELIDGLSLIRGVRVRPRRTVAKLVGMDDLGELGRALDAQVILQGTLRRRATGIQLTARLISVRDALQLWSEKYERPAHEALRLPDEVVRRTAQALFGDAARNDHTTMTVPAIEVYLRARRLLRERWAGFGDLLEVVHLFEHALELAPDDPGIVAGYAMAIARCRNFAAMKGDASPDEARAWALAEAAVAAQPERPESWLGLAALRSVESDLHGAVLALRQTLRLSPGLDVAQEMLAAIEVEVGLDDQGIARFEAATQDPNDPGTPRYHAASRHALRGRWQLFDRIVRAPVDDRFTIWRDLLLARMNLYRGVVAHPVDPVPAGARDPQVVLTAIFDSTLRQRVLPPEFEALQRSAHEARDGTRLKPLLFQVQAELLAAVGRNEDALEAVAAAVGARLFDLVWMDHCPLLRALQSAPAMQHLRAKVEARCAPIRDALTAPI